MTDWNEKLIERMNQKFLIQCPFISYEVLSVKEDADEETMRQNYERLASLTHTDVNAKSILNLSTELIHYFLIEREEIGITCLDLSGPRRGFQDNQGGNRGNTRGRPTCSKCGNSGLHFFHRAFKLTVNLKTQTVK